MSMRQPRSAVATALATMIVNATAPSLGESAAIEAPSSHQLCSTPLMNTIWLITYATAMSSPAMNTNGATAATTSFALADVVFASPPVADELPANRPPATVAIQ